MEALFLRMVTLSLACSAVLLPLLLFARRLSHRYAARTLYLLWLLLAFRLLSPLPVTLPGVALTLPVPDDTIQLPFAPENHGSSTSRSTVPLVEAAEMPPEFVMPEGPVAEVEVIREFSLETASPAGCTVRLTAALAAMWLAGAGLFLGAQSLLYLRARRVLLGPSYLAERQEDELLDELRQELGVREPVELRRTPEVEVPMVLGLFHPVVLLPEGEMADLELVLRHELCHLRWHDVAYKAVLLLCNAVHWFNPLVWWMAREASRNLELCCDDAVLRSVGEGERRAYGEALLNTAALGAPVPLSTRFGGGKKQMRDRLANLFQYKRNSAALVAAGLALALLLGGLVTFEGSTAAAQNASAAEFTGYTEDTSPAAAGPREAAGDASRIHPIWGETGLREESCETINVSRIHPVTGETGTRTDISPSQSAGINQTPADEPEPNYAEVAYGGGTFQSTEASSILEAIPVAKPGTARR